MSVYVDDAQLPYGRMKMSHMVADSTEELFAMVDKIGVARKWIQDVGEPTEHFDIALSKRKLALEAGAISVTTRDVARIVSAKRLARPPESKGGE